MFRGEKAIHFDITECRGKIGEISVSAGCYLCYIAADMLHFVEGEGYKPYKKFKVKVPESFSYLLDLIYELVVVENH